MRTSIYGQRWPRSNPADVCKSPRKAHNVTRWIFRRLFPAGHETRGSLNPLHLFLLFPQFSFLISHFPFLPAPSQSIVSHSHFGFAHINFSIWNCILHTLYDYCSLLTFDCQTATHYTECTERGEKKRSVFFSFCVSTECIQDRESI